MEVWVTEEELFSDCDSIEAAQSQALTHAKEHFHSRKFSLNEVVPTNQKFVYCVASGNFYLKAGHKEFDDRPIVSFYKRGDLFQVGPDTTLYSTEEGNEICFFYDEELRQWPALYEKYLADKQSTINRLMQQLDVASRSSSDVRLLAWLESMYEHYGVTGEEAEAQGFSPDRVTIPYYLTHKQIGDCLGLTRVTVTRRMGELRKAKYLQVDQRGYISFDGSTT